MSGVTTITYGDRILENRLDKLEQKMCAVYDALDRLDSTIIAIQENLDRHIMDGGYG